MKTVWIYQDGETLKVVAPANAANERFKIHDPEGVAFEHDVIQFIPAGSADKFDVPTARDAEK